jgi:hypothetical protein
MTPFVARRVTRTHTIQLSVPDTRRPWMIMLR